LCLLLTGKSSAVRATLLHTTGLIEDIFTSNADGIGVMYGTSKGLKISKTLPNSAAEAVVFLSKLPMDDREVAIHFRWRTHGDINLEQCHPYEVNETTALMHNGVLETGNKADPTKSDSWHFIENYLKTIPIDALHDEGFAALLGDYIDNNRFAIMSGDGRLTVINKHQGIEHGGVWFSNTYAWTPSLLIPTYPKPVVTPYKQYKGFRSYPKTDWGLGMGGVTDMWDDYESRDSGIYGSLGQTLPVAELEEGYDEYAEASLALEVDQALEESDNDTLTMYLEESPLETLRHIFATYDITDYPGAGEDDLTPAVIKVRDELMAGDLLGLMRRLEADQVGVVSDRIASCLSWFCIVEFKMEALA